MKKSKGYWKKVAVLLFSTVFIWQTTYTGIVQAENNMKNVSDEPENTILYDTNKPVVESVEIIQQGQTLHPGDTVEVLVSAYDADSEITQTKVTLALDGNDIKEIELTFDEEKQLYVGKWTLNSMPSGVYTVSRIYVQDSYNNYFEDSENYSDIWFKVENETELSISEFKMEGNGDVFADDEVYEITCSFKLNNILEEVDARIQFESEDGDQYAFETYIEEDGTFVTGGGIYKPDFVGEKTFYLESILISDFNMEIPVSEELSKQFKFTVIKNEVPEEEHGDITFENITLSKNGEIVKEGEQVEIILQVKAECELSEQATVTFHAAQDVANNTMNVTLKYDSQKGNYKGILIIEKDMYPCEWYISRLSVSGADDDCYLSKSFYDQSPYYVNVYNGNTFVEEKKDLEISFYEMNSEGKWNNVLSIHKKDVGRRFTLNDLNVLLPSNQPEIRGIKQIGWTTYSGEYSVTGDTKLINEYGKFSIYADYDKVPMWVGYRYLDEKNNLTMDKELYVLDKGATYGDLKNKCLKYAEPEMSSKQYKFVNWEVDLQLEDNLVIPYQEKYFQRTFYAIPKYKDIDLVLAQRTYIDENGHTGHEVGQYTNFVAYPVKEGISLEKAIEQIKNSNIPAMYTGLRFKNWKFYYSETDVMENGLLIGMDAEYENCIVRYMIDPRFSNWEGIYNFESEFIECQVVEKGAIVSLPTHFDGYENIKWISKPVEDDEFVVNENMSFYAVADKVTVEEKPNTNPDDDTTKPEKPNTDSNDGTSNSEKPNVDTSVTNQLSKEQIDYFVEQIGHAKDGDSIQIEMKDATIVPKDILESLQGKDIDVILNMGEYTWTINGKDVLAKDLKDINLEVKFDTDAIPISIVKELAGDNPTKKLSLTHNGDFGFKATLSINVGKEYANQFGNLYYYDSDGRMIFMNAGKITNDGSVSLDFSHASEYVVVMSDENHGVKDIQNIGTGDSSNIFAYIILMLVCIGVVTIIAKKSDKIFSKH